jgi:hypothetical protein
MHASLAVALAYDRHLNSPEPWRRTVRETYHMTHATALFSRRLRHPIERRDKDPIWGTAAALVILTFSSPDAGGPADSWPLKPPGASDFGWLHIDEGKMSLWSMANPLRQDSIFNVLAPTYGELFSPLPERGIGDVPRTLAQACGLDAASTPETNVYFTPAHAVSRLLQVKDAQVNVGHTEIFVRSIKGPFKCMLQSRDAVALLLMYLWYCKAGPNVWWIGVRAKVEGPAIYTYLRLHYKDHSAVQALLSSGGRTD